MSPRQLPPPPLEAADGGDSGRCSLPGPPLPHAPRDSPVRRWLRRHVLYVVSFVDLLAVSMIIPSLASYVKAMDGGAVAFGLIMSMYGFLQFFSAPIAGGLSDVYGRRRVLLACFVGAGAGYLLLGLSWNIYIVVLSRIPPALFKHSLDLIKVAATDGLDPTQRAATIGRLNAAANAGFIIGPIVGGYVSAVPHGFNYTTLLTTALFALNYALLATFYADPTPQTPTIDDEAKAKANTTTTTGSLLAGARDRLLEFRRVVHEPGPAQTLLAARLLLATAALLYRAHFSALLEDKFGADARARGFVLSYMGLVGTCGSAAVGPLGRLVRSERLLLQLASVVYVASFLALSRAPTLGAVYVLLLPQVLAVSLLRASSIGLQTTLVAPDRVGAFMGISSSLTSIARTVSPIVSGWSYVLAIDGPAYGAAALASLSAGLFLFSPHLALGRDRPRPPKTMALHMQ